MNAAFKGIKNFTSDIWCKPWYYDSTVGSNVSNNVDITVAPKGGTMVQVEDCLDRGHGEQPARRDPWRKESELGLNTG